MTPVRLLLSLAALLALGIGSSAAQDAPTTFEECAAVPNDVERLACYDEVAEARVPDTVAAMRAAREEEKKRKFGLFEEPIGRQLDELQVTFVKISKTIERKLRLETEDGQVWEQTDNKTAYYPSTISGTIKKGMMGSYIFSPDGNQRPIKVERVK